MSRAGHCRASILLVALLCVACTPPRVAAPAPSPQPVNDEARGRLAGAYTGFGLRLFAALHQQTPDQNIFISPASIALALAMTYNGADGQTRAAMARVLGLEGLSPDEVNRASADLRVALANPDPKVELTIANSLWVKKGLALAPLFVQRNKDYYGAQVTSLPFDSRAPAAINRWVSQNTKGKIDRIVDQIDPQTVLYLINAIYLQATWTRPFDRAATAPASFTLPGGQLKSVAMMAQQGRYHYVRALYGDRSQGFQAVRLPYGKGRVALYIVLPDAGSSLADWCSALNERSWQELVGELKEREGTVRLPRFKAEYSAQLNQALAGLGMGVAFDPQRADFPGITAGSDRVWIDQVRHRALLEVNEEGTAAAGATEVRIAASAMAEPPFEMVIDRPFFLAIRDDQTGALLFVGAVAEPQ